MAGNIPPQFLRKPSPSKGAISRRLANTAKKKGGKKKNPPPPPPQNNSNYVNDTDSDGY